MQKYYNNIVSLDFELYNSKFYWAVCWAGAAKADIDLNFTGGFDLIFNPLIKEKFIGSDMALPFSYRDLKKFQTFGEAGGRVLELLKPDTLVIGHAFENDLKMLIDVCKKFGLMLPDFDYIDTNIIYNAAYLKGGEHSLKSLADEFNIEFSPHNPAEDARAALLISKAVIKDASIYDFMSEHKIEAGGLHNGLIKKCLHSSMPDGQKRRIKNFNSVCETVEKCGQGGGKSYYIDSAVASDTDMTELAGRILAEGFSLAGSAFAADYVVTNNLSLQNGEKNIPLKSVLKKFNIDFSRYDFKPVKIRGSSGKPITLTEYYAEALKKHTRSGFLDGKKISFSRAAERNSEYENCIIKVAQNGGAVCVKVEDADIFVLEKLSELSGRSDGRVRAYNYSRRAKTMTFADFTKSLDLNKL